MRHGRDVWLIAIHFEKTELRLEYVFLCDVAHARRLCGVDAEHRSEACVIFARDAGSRSSMQATHRRCCECNRLRRTLFIQVHEMGCGHCGRENSDDAAVETFRLQATDHCAVDASCCFDADDDC